ncbi:hypothetical protein FO519_006534 [Halicephalobus sp. NKZ332]|nr:hypothetical protein FO519_006534 [Halicephalobus sp. NKZ332]
MWSTRRILGAGGALLSSVWLVKEDKQQSWRIEYPKLLNKEGEQLSRKIINDQDKTNLNLRLYQYQSCPYCCKVRAVLDYYGFSYEVIEVNPVTKSQIKFSKGYKKVPIIASSEIEKPLVESSLVVSILTTFLTRPKRKLDECADFYPIIEGTNPENGKPQLTYPNKYFIMCEDSMKSQQQLQTAREEREWREWVDEHFIHLISPNVYRSWEEALETFRIFDRAGEWERNFSSIERYLAIYIGAMAMYGISKRLKKRHNIDDERKAMMDACDLWMKSKGESRKFMGGNEPNLADLALYGAINSFVGCRTFKEMREMTGIGKWYDDVHLAVIQKQGRRMIAEKSAAIEKNK